MYHRRSIRLQGYDYTQNGAYFITICTHEKQCTFGHITDGQMQLNTWGDRVRLCWEEIGQHFPHTSTDAFVIMPNHVHGIIVIQNNDHEDITSHAPAQPRQFAKPVAGSLSTIIGAFKSAITKRINQTRKDRIPIWQGRYYEHIIRNDDDLQRIQAYIETNPQRWADDTLHRS